MFTAVKLLVLAFQTLKTPTCTKYINISEDPTVPITGQVRRSLLMELCIGNNSLKA